VSASVHVLLSGRAHDRELAAGFEEEGVPAAIEAGDGDALSLARAAARASELGLGVGADRERIVLVLAAAPARPYLEAEAAAARTFGQAVARVASRRPLSPIPTPPSRAAGRPAG
jgi:hypothetical protein